MKKATLIYNPVAGRHPARREKQIQEAVAVLLEGGIEVKLAATPGPGRAGELARAALRQGIDFILVCGGDGTVNEVINGMTPGDATLGVLPGGTANLIAKELDLPSDPVLAARQLPTWSARRIALGLASWGGALRADNRSTASADAPNPALRRRYFLSIAGVGFDAYVIHKLSSEFKLAWGVAAYFTEAIRQAFRYRFAPIHFGVEDKKLDATFAIIHRTRRYGGWLHVAPGASLFQPSFRICFFKSRKRFRYFLYAASIVLRQHLRLNDVELLEARKIQCAAQDAGTPIYFELDGELVGEIPVTFEVVTDALSLLVPESPLRRTVPPEAHGPAS